MKDMILDGIAIIKDMWGGFTMIGKVTLFPPLLIGTAIVGGMMLIFIALDDCWEAFKRVSAKIFFKP